MRGRMMSASDVNLIQTQTSLQRYKNFFPHPIIFLLECSCASLNVCVLSVYGFVARSKNFDFESIVVLQVVCKTTYYMQHHERLQ